MLKEHGLISPIELSETTRAAIEISILQLLWPLMVAFGAPLEDRGSHPVGSDNYSQTGPIPRPLLMAVSAALSLA